VNTNRKPAKKMAAHVTAWITRRMLVSDLEKGAFPGEPAAMAAGESAEQIKGRLAAERPKPGLGVTRVADQPTQRSMLPLSGEQSLCRCL